MTRTILCGLNFRNILLGAVCLVAAVCLQPVALAQHGGGFGGGHMGGGGFGGGHAGGARMSAPSGSNGAKGSSLFHFFHHNSGSAPSAGVAATRITTPVSLKSNGLLLSPVPPAHPGPKPVQQPVFFVPVYFGSPFYYGGFNSFGYGCGPLWLGGCFGSPFSGYGFGIGGYHGGFSGGWGGGYANNGWGGGGGTYAASDGSEPSTTPGPSLTQSEEPAAHRNDLVELFFKDGTVVDVTDYWVAEGQLHYVTVDESGQKTQEHVVAFDTLDVQTTRDDNNSRGFKFVLRNESMEQYYREHPEVVPKVVGPAGEQ